MKASPCRGRCFFHWIVRQEVRDFAHQPCRCQRLLNIVALKVNVGIDLVRDAIVALVPLEADVMGCRSYPQSFAPHLKRRFPDSQVVARSHHADWLRVSPAVILRTSKKVKLAHGHSEIRFLRNAFNQSVENRSLHIGIHFDPASRRENPLHRGFRTKNQKVRHVARMSIFVADASRDFGE
jgi:hypothetical protein